MDSTLESPSRKCSTTAEERAGGVPHPLSLRVRHQAPSLSPRLRSLRRIGARLPDQDSGLRRPGSLSLRGSPGPETGRRGEYKPGLQIVQAAWEIRRSQVKDYALHPFDAGNLSAATAGH